MIVKISKTEKGEAVPHKVYVNDLVVKTVSELEEATKQLRRNYVEWLNNKIESIKNTKISDVDKRKEIDKLLQNDISDYLFISECPQFESRASLPKAFDWNRSKLYPFLRRWNISDKYGDVYYFSSHSFRPTFVRELIKKGIKIGFIQKQFDHTTIEMTCHYLQLEEDEIKGIYSEMLLIPESKIAGIRANEIKQELSSMFEGKTSIEIQEITKDLVSSMQFNTLPTGVCLYDVRRGNCTDGDGCFMYNCPNYLTEIQFYPLLKKELEVLELEMRRYKEQGRERDFQRQYIKWKYLKPLVDGLEIQL